MQKVMGSTFRRLRIYYINNIRISRIIAFLAGVTILYLLANTLFPGDSKYGVVRQKVGESITGLLTDAEVQRYIDALQDTRPVDCRDQDYDFTRLEFPERISILMDYHDKQFYDLQLTLNSVVDHTPFDLYEEIVIIDDGTSDDVIKKQVAQYLKNPKFTKVKLYRSESVDGQASTRFKASQLAKGTILIYVSSSTIVNHGWIQPLISHVAQDEQLIVVPHADNLLAGHRFYRTDDQLVSVFSWSLFTVYTDTSSGQAQQQGVQDGYTELLSSPVMRGDVFAVKKSFLTSIGNFDENFRGGEGGSGHHLELSLRAWMCGGQVKISQCSRIAVHSSLRPQHITDPFNYRRLLELWFGDYKPLSYHQGGVSKELPSDEVRSLQIRTSQLKQVHTEQQVHCKDFNWYLENIARHIEVPTDEMIRFGKVKVKSNYCLRANKGQTGNKVDLDMALCRQHIYDRAMMFELDTKGQIFNGEQCLEPDKIGRVGLVACTEASKRQRWRVNGARIEHVASRGKCLSQAMDRDEVSLELNHYVTIEDCFTEKSAESVVRLQTWEFVDY